MVSANETESEKIEKVDEPEEVKTVYSFLAAISSEILGVEDAQNVGESVNAILIGNAEAILTENVGGNLHAEEEMTENLSEMKENEFLKIKEVDGETWIGMKGDPSSEKVNVDASVNANENEVVQAMKENANETCEVSEVEKNEPVKSGVEKMMEKESVKSAV